MIKSMTGYGKAVAELAGKKVHVEVKSLNSKALDLSLRVAATYREKEIEIRTEIAKALERGKVDFTLWVEKNANSAGSINHSVFEYYHNQITELAAKFSLPLPEDWFGTILRMPDVTSSMDNEEIDEEEWLTVKQAINTALQRLDEFRIQEGKALEAKFREKIDNISRLLTEVETYETERVDKIKSRIVEAIEKVAGVDYDKNRLEQELIYYIEKLDVSEEKQRLTNHLKYFIDTMNDGHGQGKKLGFIAQEMGREINTLGSKSNHAEMQKVVVRMKDELEQIKEQVLNVM